MEWGRCATPARLTRKKFTQIPQIFADGLGGIEADGAGYMGLG